MANAPAAITALVQIEWLMQLLDDGFIGLAASPLVWVEDEAMTRPPRFLPPTANNTQQPWPQKA